VPARHCPISTAQREKRSSDAKVPKSDDGRSGIYEWLSFIVMSSPHLLLVGWGTETSLEGVRESMPSCDYQAAELRITCPATDYEVAQIGEAVASWNPDLLVLVLLSDPVVPAWILFSELAGKNKWKVPMLVVCPTARPKEVAQLLKLGALEVVTTPLRLAELVPRLLASRDRAEQQKCPVAKLRAALGLEHIIGDSPALVALIKQIPRIAKYQVSVLILGETGTGKEVFARAIHYGSPRATKPFIPVNCGAIPVDLLENEFFGHESGAFTSANCSRRGVIKEADGGTLFLDEVDCLPPLAQVKLLRFLQDGQFRPLGSASVCTADVRVIAASNAHLAEALESGRFRKDLYYRLNVLSLQLPPLRQREDDVVLLARHFLGKYTERHRTPVREFSPEALQKLVGHSWPGNVRELENVVQRAVVLADQAVLGAEHICTGDGTENGLEDHSFQQAKAKAIDRFEENYIRRLLLIHDGNITKAARGAGKDRRAFWELMRKHHISARPSSPGNHTGKALPG
jgi:two-component system, NtrC family, response regulator GlrR